MWWSQGCGNVTGNATGVHKILLFPVCVGQPGQEESLCKQTVAQTNIADARGKKCLQYSCSSGENLSAPFAHKAGPHEKLCERYG